MDKCEAQLKKMVGANESFLKKLLLCQKVRNCKKETLSLAPGEKRPAQRNSLLSHNFPAPLCSCPGKGKGCYRCSEIGCWALEYIAAAPKYALIRDIIERRICIYFSKTTKRGLRCCCIIEQQDQFLERFERKRMCLLMKITVIGCGRWGSFLAWYLDTLEHEVTLCGRPGSSHLEQFRRTRSNGLITFPPTVAFSTHQQAAVRTVKFWSFQWRSKPPGTEGRLPVEKLRGKPCFVHERD